MAMLSPRPYVTRIALTAAFSVSLLSVTTAFGQNGEEGDAIRGQAGAAEPLTTKQSRLAERYDRLEMLAGRLAELSRATQPRRARLLRELVANSRERDISGRFETIVDSLQQESLGKAATAQGQLRADLQKLLELLLQEDRDKQIESERKRIRKYLAELKRLIQLQRGIKARTDGGDEAKDLTDDQQKLSQATGKLEQEITTNEITPEDATTSQEEKSAEPEGDTNNGNRQGEKSDGEQNDKSPQGGSSDSKPGEKQPADGQQSPSEKPQSEENPDSQGQPGEQSQGQPSQNQQSEGQPSQGQGQSQPGEQGDQQDQPSEQAESPAQRAQQRLQRAQQRMQQALEELEEAKRENAVERQERALRELEQAKAELERILRQLREEERERMLVLLEARFRKMLDAQVIVYEQTKKLDESRSTVQEHEIEIASGRLSRQEREIVREADRALVLLREDGTTVAFPEAIEQAREDMESVEQRLAEVKTGMITQGLEEDIIAALEETLAALQQALKKARAQKGQPQQPSGGGPTEEDLIDQLAELRMIRALQNRINRRTERYGKIIGDEITADPELLEALDELAVRQERVFQATRDLESGRNK